jgi:hypothetical protein
MQKGIPFPYEYAEKKKKKNTRLPCAVSLLQAGVSVLLDVPVRFYHLSGVHGAELLGNVVQWNHLAVPGLREVERFRQSVVEGSAVPAGFGVLLDHLEEKLPVGIIDFHKTEAEADRLVLIVDAAKIRPPDLAGDFYDPVVRGHDRKTDHFVEGKPFIATDRHPVCGDVDRLSADAPGFGVDRNRPLDLYSFAVSAFFLI